MRLIIFKLPFWSVQRKFDLKSQVWTQTKIARHEVQLPVNHIHFWSCFVLKPKIMRFSLHLKSIGCFVFLLWDWMFKTVGLQNWNNTICHRDWDLSICCLLKGSASILEQTSRSYSGLKLGLFVTKWGLFVQFQRVPFGKPTQIYIWSV